MQGTKWGGLLPISSFGSRHCKWCRNRKSVVFATGVPERTTRRACAHNRPVVLSAASTTAQACLRPSASCTTEELCRDRAFSVVIGVFGFHVATWSRVSRHRFSVVGVSVSRQGKCCRDKVPKQIGRVGSLQRFHCHDREGLAPCLDRDSMSRQRWLLGYRDLAFGVAGGLVSGHCCDKRAPKA